MGAKLDRSPNASLNRIGTSTRAVTDRIVRTFERATPADLEAGATWYSEAREVALELADLAGSVENAAAVISHLSPRTPWARNLMGAHALIRDGRKATGILGDNYARAVDSLDYADPAESFSGPKTRRFYANIIGDDEAVTVDVWAARVAGVTEADLGKVGVYDAVEHAYRLAARRCGVSPATMQATTWIVARGGRAA